MPSLEQQKCVPCRGDEPPLTEKEISDLKSDVPEWQVLDDAGVKKLRRSFEFDDFAQALDFTNQIGAIAEEEDHHPVIETTWGRVTVTWWTHKIEGLHKNDFIMAAKSDDLFTQ